MRPFCFVFLFFLGATISRSEEKVEIPLPVSPEQTIAWTPPDTKLPKSVVDAIAEMFKDGLPDPRGCEYHQLRLSPAMEPGSSNLFPVRGWLLPNTGSGKFAILWDGEITAVDGVGPIAQISEEINQFIAQRKHLGQSGEFMLGPNTQPIQAALLFRLGYVKEAESIWPETAQDPFSEMADPWTAALFSSAVSNHELGSDALALLNAQELTRALPLLKTSDPQLDFNYLSQLPQLLADESRRVKEPARSSALNSDRKGPERIAALIQDLEFVSARQMAIPGSVHLMDDPIVRALVHEGDPAIEPLLDCLEHDDRLTRSVGNVRPWFKERFLYSVARAAFEALCNILNTDEFGAELEGATSTHEGRKMLADKIRAFVNRFQSKTPQEVDFEMLSDDKADPKQWLKSAFHIIISADFNPTPESDFDSYSGGTTFPPEHQDELKGEILRTKTNPSVSDLLIKRLGQFKEGSEDDSSKMEGALNLAKALAIWDGKAHLDILRDFTQSFHISQYNMQLAGEKLVELYGKRIDLGDPGAAQDFSDFMLAHQATDLFEGFLPQEPFKILVRHPKELADLADKMFSEPKYGWVPLLGNPRLSELPDYINSYLVTLPAFRKELLRGLSDTSLSGTVTVDAGGGQTINSGGGQSTEGQPDVGAKDPLRPPAGKEVPFRVCDFYAFKLSRLQGAPLCQLYWPREKCDEAVEKSIAFLNKYGPNFVYDPEEADSPMSDFEPALAKIHFPLLDHPATEDDVKAGRAIFSMAGARLFHLPRLPIDACWTGYSGRPTSDAFGEADKNNGTVWQAEEVKENGKWRGYFGFTCPGHLLKLPVEDLKFYPKADSRFRLIVTPDFKTADFNGGHVTADDGEKNLFEGCLEIQSNGQQKSGGFFETFLPNAPITLVDKVTNLSALEQALPGSAKTFAAMLAEPDLTYCPVIPDLNHNTQPPMAFSPVAHKTPAEPSTSSTPLILAGLETRIIGTCDLRDFFEIQHAGFYRLEAKDKSGCLLFVVAGQEH